VNPDRQVRWVLRAFLAAGVVLLVVAAVVLVRTVQFVADAERATGTVVDLSRERDSEGDVLFYPVVRFTIISEPHERSEAETAELMARLARLESGDQ